MIIFDAHCDTIQKVNDYGGNLFSNDFHIDIDRIIKQYSNYVQIFAVYIDKASVFKSPFERCNELINRYWTEINQNQRYITHCNTFEEIQSGLNGGRISSLLSIEGGEAFEGETENLYLFYEKGVRAVTLTWNYDNEISGGIENNCSGLSEFGKTVVCEMNRLNMLIDVSHISEKGFWDVIELTNKPIAATHSNARKICNHKRNLDDEQIRAIIKNNGCIGMNLYKDFISTGKCEIKDILLHIEHILSLGGENNIGLGCDFDGAEKFPEGIKGVEGISMLVDEMQKIGYTDLLIKKILSDNFLELMKKIII